MRRTINISVSEEMYSVILDRTRDGYYDSVSEYIRSLVRENQKTSSRGQAVGTLKRANDYLLTLPGTDDDPE